MLLKLVILLFRYILYIISLNTFSAIAEHYYNGFVN